MSNEENLVTENVATPITETKPPTVLEKPKKEKKPKAVKETKAVKEPEKVVYTHFEERKLSIDAETADEDYFTRNGQR